MFQAVELGTQEVPRPQEKKPSVPSISLPYRCLVGQDHRLEEERKQEQTELELTWIKVMKTRYVRLQ